MKKNEKIKKLLCELLPYIVILVVVILVKTYVIAPVQVNGSSMMNTLHNKDIMLLNKINYRFEDIERFDIVVIKYENTHLIKRVIGLPGDNIEYKDNKLYINNEYYEEKYLDKNTTTEDFNLKELIKTDKIPSNCYFVMGDNRNESLDSRALGVFNKKEIEGKTSLIIYPFTRFGTKK